MGLRELAQGFTGSERTEAHWHCLRLKPWFLTSDGNAPVTGLSPEPSSRVVFKVLSYSIPSYFPAFSFSWLLSLVFSTQIPY
jgi:hypothetical protein